MSKEKCTWCNTQTGNGFRWKTSCDRLPFTDEKVDDVDVCPFCKKEINVVIIPENLNPKQRVNEFMCWLETQLDNGLDELISVNTVIDKANEVLLCQKTL